MVERPIKKSERQAVAPQSEVGEGVKEKRHPIKERLDSTTSTPEDRSATRSLRGKDNSKRKGKSKQKDSPSSNVNPALVRGPKPTKPKPPVIQEVPSETEDSATEADQETITEE